MKIVKLVAENIKRIVAVEVRPQDGELVQITGRNGAGKSSLLDSIWWALAGTRTHQERPIRDGQTEARVEVDMGELLVTRGFREQRGGRVTTSLKVESVDGDTKKRLPSPQKVLDALLGSIAFDPLAFIRMTPADQTKALTDLCGLDLTEHEALQKEDRTERRHINREVKRLTAEVRIAAKAIPPGTPKRVDVDAILTALNSAQASNRRRLVVEQEIRGASQTAHRADQELSAARGQIAELERRLEDAHKRTKAAQAVAKTAEERLAALEEGYAEMDAEIDLGALRQQIQKGNAINRDVDRMEERGRRLKELRAALKEAEASSKMFTNRINQRELDFRASVQNAELPVEGLGVDRGLVVFDGLPLSQASGAEKLRISVAIAMRKNAELRVILIRDGSLLDDISLKLLAEIAKEENYQVWIERVDSSGAVGIVIEDGMVAEVA